MRPCRAVHSILLIDGHVINEWCRVFICKVSLGHQLPTCSDSSIWTQARDRQCPALSVNYVTLVNRATDVKIGTIHTKIEVCQGSRLPKVLLLLMIEQRSARCGIEARHETSASVVSYCSITAMDTSFMMEGHINPAIVVIEQAILNDCMLAFSRSTMDVSDHL